ncbi:uncharacterized protein JCM10292_002085 [Rhodotorula paludigena]|uniref:uncharacterized protein n=1 Tax=Rhodotorula paludigena TaxID=86838 RepID=UPI0031707BE2
MTKAPRVKLPSSRDPIYRAFYAAENEKLKVEKPASTGAYRRKMIQSLWRKQHSPDAAQQDKAVSSSKVRAATASPKKRGKAGGESE